MANSIKSAAILGGAFDPITKGHTQVVELLLAAGIGIDEVWIMPCYRHAFDKQMALAASRIEMCELACRKIKNTKVIDYEIRKKFRGATFFLMADMLEEDFIKGTYDVSLAIGLDNANSFAQWIEHEKLMRLVPFIVISRQGIQRDPAVDWYTKEPHLYIDAGKKIMEVSSTEVRAKLSKKTYDEAGELLDPEVLRYIISRGLYA